MSYVYVLEMIIVYLISSAVIKDIFLCQHVWSNSIPKVTIVDKTMVRKEMQTGDVPTKILTSSYAVDHQDWPGKQWRAEHQACRWLAFRKQSSLFEGLFYLYFVFLNNVYSFFFKIVHYYMYVNKTESLSTCHIFSKLLFCRQFCWQSACRWQHY